MPISAMDFHLQILKVSGIKGIPPHLLLGVPCAQWQHEVQMCHPQDKCAMGVGRRNYHSSYTIRKAIFEAQA